MWLAEPRSSLVPHFDGQRWFSGGGVQLGVCARATLPAMSRAAVAAPIAIRCIDSSHYFVCFRTRSGPPSMRRATLSRKPVAEDACKVAWQDGRARSLGATPRRPGFVVDLLNDVGINREVHDMNIVIVGAGNVGRALAGGWRNAGHSVALAVRDPAAEKAGALKQQGFNIVASNGAAAAGDIVVLAVPWPALGNAVKQLGSLAGKIVIDAINPLTPDFSLAIGHDDSAGETVARLAP